MARQAWNRKGEWDRAVLEHVRTMLLVLAALVERAAGLPTVERLGFLAVMGRGEAEVRRRIVAMANDNGNPAGVFAALPATADPFASTPAMMSGDAALLAARFRMLALALDAMLARAGPRPPHRHASPSLPLSRRALPVSQNTPSPALRATSPPQAGERSRSFHLDTLLRTGACAPVAIGVRLTAAVATGAPLPRAGGEVPSEARR